MNSFALFGIIAISFACTVYAKEASVESTASSLLTGPSELKTPSSKETARFSRLLHDNAAALQFSSISNLAPRIKGIPKDPKDTKLKNHKKSSLSPTHLGRRTLDYDDSENFGETGEPLPRIITQPQPGNEYVYIRQGGVQTEEQQAAEASVTSINRQPANHRVPLTLLRKTDGKRVNISPAFADSTGNTFENPQPFKNEQVSKDESDTTTSVNGDEVIEFTTMASSNNDEQNDQGSMVVNVITSKPRAESDGRSLNSDSYLPRKSKSLDLTTTSAPVNETAEANKTAEDVNENLLVQSTRRIGSFPDFEDSPTRLQTAESSSQPARVNVRPAQSGKEYEYEYIYYYYDDEDEDNSTSKTPGKKGNGTKSPGGQGSTSTQGTTSTTTSLPVIENNDFDDEEIEVDEPEVEEPPKVSSTLAPVKSTPEPIKENVISSEKFSNSNPNQLDRSRGPKQTFPTAKLTSEVDYKIEAGDFDHQYEDEEEENQVKAKGQPQRQQLEDEDIEDEQPEVQSPVSQAPVTSAPTSTTNDPHSMATMAKSHPDSVNSPIILKQSSILQSVPASRLHPQNEDTNQIRQTSPFTTRTTTTTTTTTTTEAPSETPSARPGSSSRFRGQQRIRGSINRETTPKTTTEHAVVEEKEEPVHKPKPTGNRFNKDSSRRLPSRRPHVETSQVAPESPISESSKDAPARHNPVRTRFPTRTSPIPATAAPEPAPVSESKAPELSTPVPVVNEVISTEEPTSQTKAEENYVRSKSANDLFTFTRLQQAISSRAPARKELTGKGPTFLKPSIANSIEQSTEATISSEATTLVPLIDAAHSSEVQPAIAVTPSTTTTTTTTTTTETVPAGGKQRGRFGRPRRPLSNSSGESSGSSTTEASASSTVRIPSRNRFTGRRKPASSTPAESTNAETPSESPSDTSEAPKPRAPTATRNRFATRNRGSTTEAPATANNDEKKEGSASEPTVVSPTSSSGAGQARRKPIFQGRRRNPSVASPSTAVPAHSDATEVEVKDEVVAPVSSTTAAPAPVQAEEQAPVETERKRPGLPNIQRRRPGAGGRIRGGRLGGPTSTTTEAPAPTANKSEEKAPEQLDAEQSPTSQSEQLESAPPSVSSSAAAPVDNSKNRGNTGVIGRLRTRPSKLVTTTTTAAPEPAVQERKPSRLNGILNRRKAGGPITTSTAAPTREESKAEVAEEANNNAQEQQDSQSQHKGVVVQVSSSITESEETNDQHQGEEEIVPSSTTAASILNRLKSQRKPGSIFRKRTDPHGE